MVNYEVTPKGFEGTVKYSAIAWASSVKDGIKTTRNISIQANVIPTDAQHPFMVLNQVRSKVKFKVLNMTQGKPSVTLDYNLSVPDLCILYEQAKRCYMEGNAGEIKGACGTGEKMVGSPDENGFAPVKKIVINHNANEDGSNRYPWYISIEHGTALAVMNDDGTRYAQPGTYKCESRTYINISEEDMFNLCFWAERCIDIFIEGTKNSMLRAWNNLQKEPQAQEAV